MFANQIIILTFILCRNTTETFNNLVKISGPSPRLKRKKRTHIGFLIIKIEQVLLSLHMKPLFAISIYIL